MAPPMELDTHADKSGNDLLMLPFAETAENASSKTMPLQEVVDFATKVKPVLKHFKNSAKSQNLLNKAVDFLNMI